MRRSSATFLQHQGFELTSENRHQLYVPPGFAHGFQTLSDDAEVTYLVSAAYTPEAEGGVRCPDPRLSIEWPLPITNLSAKDASWPLDRKSVEQGKMVSGRVDLGGRRNIK